MRLIDKDVLIKAIDEGFMMTSEDIEGMTEVKAIPTDWLRKELIECLYDGVSSEDVNKVFFKAIAKWEKENESRIGD